jgi:hypothetical protein
VFGRGLELARLRHTRDGFVAITQGRAFAFGTAHDDQLRVVSLAHDLGLGVEVALDPETLATEPGANLVALGGAGLVVVDVDATAVLARALPPQRGARVGQVAFAGPDRLVTQIGQGRKDRNGAAVWDALATWRLAGGTLTYEGSVPARSWGSRWPAGIPAHRQVVTTLLGAQPARGGSPLFRDATTLRLDMSPAPSLAGLTGVTEMVAGPDGAHLVVLRRSGPDVEDDDTIEVHQLRPLHHVLRRPLGELATTDPNPAAAGVPVGSPAVRELLDVFHACLQDRRAAGQAVHQV